MNFKLTLALTILLLLALCAYLMVPQPVDPVKTIENAGSTLIDPKPGEITSISYRSRMGEELKFTKESDYWKLTSPIKAEADTTMLNGIASSLQSLAYTQKFAAEEKGPRSPEYTGTLKPSQVITFSDGKRDYAVSIGKRGSQGVFATLSGDKNIYVLETDPTRQLEKRPNDFRNTRIIELDEMKIASVTFKTRDYGWQITKSSDKWLVSQPVSARPVLPIECV